MKTIRIEFVLIALIFISWWHVFSTNEMIQNGLSLCIPLVHDAPTQPQEIPKAIIIQNENLKKNSDLKEIDMEEWTVIADNGLMWEGIRL